jgi:hypothetical protein
MVVQIKVEVSESAIKEARVAVAAMRETIDERRGVNSILESALEEHLKKCSKPECAAERLIRERISTSEQAIASAENLVQFLEQVQHKYADALALN